MSQQQLSSLDALIQAAQYLEENGHDKDEEEEIPRKRPRYRSKKPSTYSVARSRTTHNLLEKNRRAQLRDCLEVLRQHVPLPDKLTTLALLQSARKYIEGLQQKEREENQLKLKLQNEQHVLISRLVELGATGYLNTLSSSTSPTPPPSSVAAAAAAAAVACVEMSPESTSPKNDEQARRTQRTSLRKDHIVGKGQEEDENMVIDVLSHESEDDNSSTTSGSDGGCTSTSHKYELAV